MSIKGKMENNIYTMQRSLFTISPLFHITVHYTFCISQHFHWPVQGIQMAKVFSWTGRQVRRRELTEILRCARISIVCYSRGGEGREGVGFPKVYELISTRQSYRALK
jgi:hypothetical protein